MRTSSEDFTVKKAVRSTLPFVLSTREGVPRGILGDYPLLSMKDEYHAYDYVATLAFFVSKALGNDSYYLIDAQKPRARKRDDSGKESERPWNANLLRRFYS